MGSICFKSNVETINVRSSKANGYNTKPRLSAARPIPRPDHPPPPPPTPLRIRPPQAPPTPPPPTLLVPLERPPANSPPPKPLRKHPPKRQKSKDEIFVIGFADELEPVQALPVANGNRAPSPPGTIKSGSTEQYRSNVSVSNVSVHRPGSLVSSTLGTNHEMDVEELDTEMDDYTRLRLVGPSSLRRPRSEHLHLLKNRTFVVTNGYLARSRPSSDRPHTLTSPGS